MRLLRALGVLLLVLAPDSGQAGKGEGKDPLSSKAGYTFLSDFQCDSKGDVTRRVQESMAQLHNDMSKINDSEQECKAAIEAVNFPSLQKIIDRFQSDEVLQEIEEQQRTLTEALADQATITELMKADPNDPAIKRDYPPLSRLDVTIQDAQSTLLRLRSQVGFDKAQQGAVRFVAGGTELNSLGEQLVQGLKSGKDCYNKNPLVRKHVTAAIMGISGFFLNSPLGIATTVAGKLLQQVFAINEAPDRLAEAEKSEDSATMVAGLSCAYEYLGKQHCRILRERTLYSATLNRDSSDSKSLADLKAGLRTQGRVNEAVTRLEAWSNKTKTASNDPMIRGVRLSASSYYFQKSSEFQQAIIQAQEAARVAAAGSDNGRVGQTLRTKLTEALGTIALLLNPGRLRDDGNGMMNNGGLGGRQGAEFIASNFDQETQVRDFMYMLFEPSDNPEQIFQAMVKEYLDGKKKTDPQAYVNPTSAYNIFVWMSKDPTLQGPVYRRIASMLESPQMPERLQNKLQELTNKISAETTVALTADQTNNIVQEFRNGANPLLRNASPQASLIAMRDALLEARPKLEGTAADEFDQFSGRAALRKDIAGMIELSKKATAAGASEKDQLSFMTFVNEKFGKNRDLVGRLNTLFDSLNAANMDSLDEESARTSNPNLRLQANLLVNQSLIQETIGFPSNPSSRFADYDTAQMLSGGEIDAFTNFTRNYLPRAFKFLRGEDVSTGMKENIPSGTKDRLCITLLAMTNLDKQVVANCSGAKLTSGKTEVSFSSLMGLSQPKRACALYDFQVHERFEREQELRGPAAEGTRNPPAAPAR